MMPCSRWTREIYSARSMLSRAYSRVEPKPKLNHRPARSRSVVQCDYFINMKYILSVMAIIPSAVACPPIYKF